jgi:hypothetical protein
MTPIRGAKSLSRVIRVTPEASMISWRSHRTPTFNVSSGSLAGDDHLLARRRAQPKVGVSCNAVPRASTVAPGSGAPVSSETVPVIEPVVCARRVEERRERSRATRVTPEVVRTSNLQLVVVSILARRPSVW